MKTAVTVFKMQKTNDDELGHLSQQKMSLAEKKIWFERARLTHVTRIQSLLLERLERSGIWSVVLVSDRIALIDVSLLRPWVNERMDHRHRRAAIQRNKNLCTASEEVSLRQTANGKDLFFWLTYDYSVILYTSILVHSHTKKNQTYFHFRK